MTYSDARENLLADLRSGVLSGRDFVRRLSGAMDDFVLNLAREKLGGNSDISLVALGGYGRRELCPFSDIDLMFLVPTNADQKTNERIESFLYAIWDSGLKIGHSIRTVRDCVNMARDDLTVQTTLLDARRIGGPEELFDKLQKSLLRERTDSRIAKYVSATLDARDRRHKRLGDTRYVLEPNIKEGKGGLRDVQSLFWIAETVYGARTPKDLKELDILTAREAVKFRKAHDYLLTVRCHLHDIAGRGEERLHFDAQPALAERLGYRDRDNARAVERFMKHYFLVSRDVGDLTRIICAAIEARGDNGKGYKKGPSGLSVLNGRLCFPESADIREQPDMILKLFHAAQDSGLDIHPFALRDVTRNLRTVSRDLRRSKTARKLFLDILLNDKGAALTLRRMNEAGVLGRLIPDFGRVNALMQFDRYHVFTVDEHTIRAVDILHKIEDGAVKDEAPLACALIHEIGNRRALFVAMFLHDICKGLGGDHSLLGAEFALAFCPRFGLSDAETRLVSWLVFDHLVMSDTAFKRDLEDPKTIDDFVFRVYAPERLNLLLVLTTADIMAVGPERWTAWKARLLEELYYKAMEGMRGRTKKSEDIAVPEDYEPGATHIEIAPAEDQDATSVTVCTSDRPGLFATLAGGLSAAGANIIEARINTLDDGTAIDVFTVQNMAGRPIDKKWRQEELKKSVLAALDGALDIKEQIQRHMDSGPKKDDVFEVETRIKVNNKASRTDTVLEIAARDRPGLLYDITRALSEEGLQIRSAKITTLGLKAIDVFYVQDAEGKKLKKTDALKARLTATI